jgi:hypothetical protein
VVSRARALAGLAPAAQLVLAVAVAATGGTGGALSLVGGLILGPIAVVVTSLCARRLAGPAYGIAAGWSFVLLPVVALLFFTSAYRSTWTHEVLPSLVGVRDTRWYALGVLIALVAAFAPVVVLGALGVIGLVAGAVTYGFGDLSDVRVGIHETGWSVALAEWLPVAGAIGVARRSVLTAIGIAGWLVFFALRAASEGYDAGAFWAGLAPALPAAALLVTSIGLLVPPLRRPRPQPAS